MVASFRDRPPRYPVQRPSESRFFPALPTAPAQIGVRQIDGLATEVLRDLPLHGFWHAVPVQVWIVVRDTQNGCGEIGSGNAGPLPPPHHLELLAIQPVRLRRGISCHVRDTRTPLYRQTACGAAWRRSLLACDPSPSRARARCTGFSGSSAGRLAEDVI